MSTPTWKTTLIETPPAGGAGHPIDQIKEVATIMGYEFFSYYGTIYNTSDGTEAGFTAADLDK